MLWSVVKDINFTAKSKFLLRIIFTYFKKNITWNKKKISCWENVNSW